MNSGEALLALARAAREIAEAPAPGEAFATLDRAAAELLGHRLFTTMLYHPDTGEAERLYSSHEKEYPVGGRKPLRRDRWSETVIDRGDVLLLKDEAGIRLHFADYQKIFSLGCGSIICVPVRGAGEPVGTMNVLHQAGWFSETQVPLARILAGLAAPAYLAVRAGRRSPRLR